MNIPSSSAYSLIRPAHRWLEIPLLLSFNLLIVGLAQAAINLPFSPVPITGQTLGVLLVAMTLGRVRGTAVVMAYVLEGLAGLPVFANGTAGPAVLMGPTGGYLLGFVASAWVVGTLADRGFDRSYLKSGIAMVTGTVIIFLCGLSWLVHFVPGSAVFTAGLYPFIPGAVLKIVVVFAVLPSIWRYVGRK